MKKILVSGANGQLGSELNLLSENYNQFEWFFADRTHLTLDNLSVLENQLGLVNPDIIINCGAYTAVDKAESEQELADTINHLAVGVLAKWSLKNDAKLVHISTDYVFDGTSSIALTEDASTDPINIYGATKLAGEHLCLQNNPQAIILRTSWVYSSFGNNFVKTMSRLMKERETLSVVNDQIGSPTYAADLAEAILTIITHSDWKAGIYNFSNEGEISWYEFALAIKEIGGYTCEVSGIPSSSYPTPAKRPAYSLLDKSKIKKEFQVKVPNYKESLKVMMSL
ncbi:dTDP-4-dehydrorhamnose reductase [Flavobacterium sp. Fl-318]|uniref:dTDP-4-dehydrorhamnose reductase n=1 Tax=Flavobacterium cupriresistens TaxID=2893885 RepID=A0ABU4RHU3_9FLAO|nr:MULTISPECIES: dTDP-4-dehydrorhamnose reductase [unclassified Flavobacterium]MDX6190111.1 dTDP-4-dehydrorhamnose reductase [Flavobacterium sp. Fl-318]UFH42932.1 dTDP-4-dehydrorhamnose reductase [Flavobacterium sp. F-323]